MADLVCAAQTNDLDSLRRLLDLERANNPQLGTSSAHPSTTAMQDASYAAARYNHPAALDILLNSGCFIGPGTIGAAIDGSSKEIFDLLIAHGWHPNAHLGHSGDALLMSVGAGNLDIVQFLLSRGADPNANKTTGSSRPLEFAAWGASIPIIEALLDAGAELKGRSALPNAAAKGRTDLVTYLLDRGADIDEIPENDDITENARKLGIRNALCKAASEGQLAVVEMLLERGADASIRDTNGRSALELAEREGHESCVEILS